MNKELYIKLKEIEDTLFKLAKENNKIFNDKLGDIWLELWAYIEKEKPDDL